VFENNVVSGNDSTNIQLDATASGVLIEDNLVGTDASGNASLVAPQGLATSGIVIVGRDNTVRGNVISANPVDGLTIDGLNMSDGRGSGNVVQDNLIGVGLDGVTPLGNGCDGVRIWRGASDNTIGTDGNGVGDEVEGNTIQNNAKSGVIVLDATSIGNNIRRNSIDTNGGLGIDLGDDGVTANDIEDPDTGPNSLQNTPVIEKVRFGKDVRVEAYLRSQPNSEFVIDFYASAFSDPSGHGEGDRWIGSVVRTTNKSGHVGYVIDFTGLNEGEWITATATNSHHSTSEFSSAFRVQKGGGKGKGMQLLTAESSGMTESLIKSSEISAPLADPAGRNLDGRVSPDDALLVINQIGRIGSAAARTHHDSEGGFGRSPLDVNQDDCISVLDALIVINRVATIDVVGQSIPDQTPRDATSDASVGHLPFEMEGELLDILASDQLELE
jgi:hypothetical protein